MRASHGPVANPVLWGAQDCSCYLGVVPLSLLVSHPANQDGLHHDGFCQHCMHSCANLLDNGRKEEDCEQSQCSRFYCLKNWGLENSDSSQWVPTHQSLHRTLSFWHTWRKHWGAFKMRAVQSWRSTKWLARLCQTGCCSKSLGKAGVSRTFPEKGCSRISDICPCHPLRFPRQYDKD